MSILSDFELKKLCQDVERPMIKPYSEHAIREVISELEVPGRVGPLRSHRKVLSYGQSSYGYDVSLAEEFKLFTNLNSTIIDPKRFDDSCLVTAELKSDKDGSKYVILPPNSYILGHTIEVFNIPRDIMVICVGKSTYARAGLQVNVTPIEPGFEGTVVLELANSTNLPMKIYANEGIAQFLFFQGNVECDVSYADRAGKYQGQRGIVNSKV